MLHIGADKNIALTDIVLIVDYESALDSKDSKNFLTIAKEEGFVRDYSNGNPKSLIVTDETIYLSLISSETLAKRSNFVYDLGSKVSK